MSMFWWFWCYRSLITNFLYFSAARASFSWPNCCGWEPHVCGWEWQTGKLNFHLLVCFLLKYFLSLFSVVKEPWSHAMKLKISNKVFNSTGEQCRCWCHNRKEITNIKRLSLLYSLEIVYILWNRHDCHCLKKLFPIWGTVAVLIEMYQNMRGEMNIRLLIVIALLTHYCVLLNYSLY